MARLKKAVFTIVSANYISFAATLMSSIATSNADVDRFVILADARQDFKDLTMNATLLHCDELGIKNIDNMKLWYTVIEFNTAIKPFSFAYLFNQHYDNVCYLDPDIYVFKSLDIVFNALKKASCVLTPHILEPLEDGREPSDLTIMKSGIYNLGFLGLKNDGDGRRLAAWWSRRCYLDCRVDLPAHKFTDQRWMDLAPSFVDKVSILRNAGLNVAYWNLPHRTIGKDERGDWTANGEKLIFFHFSGIKPEDREQFSKHTNRDEIVHIEEVKRLYDEYRTIVLANGWSTFSKLTYAYSRFEDGRPIEDAMRRWLARAAEEEIIDRSSPLAVTASFFDECDKRFDVDDFPLNRLIYQFWLDRVDLQQAFNVYDKLGRQAYRDWLRHDPSVSSSFSSSTYLSVLAFLERTSSKTSIALTRHQSAVSPWSPVSHTFWGGKAAEALEYFARDLKFAIDGDEIAIPRIMGFYWEMRVDLQHHFPLTTKGSVSDYIEWFLTSGLRDNPNFGQLLTASFVEYMNSLSAMSDFYADVPISVGSLTVRPVASKRKVPGFEGFPVEKRGRLGRSFWFSYVGPVEFGWPLDMVSSVKQYFEQLSSVHVDGYSFPVSLVTLWEVREDLQRAFSLKDARSRWLFLRWLLFHGLNELGLRVVDFDPALDMHLKSVSPRLPGVTRVAEFVYVSRPELHASLDILKADDLASLHRWMSGSGAESIGVALQEYGTRGAQLPAIREDQFNVKVLLTGQYTERSGRGEDVRMTAASLVAAGTEDFLIFDIDSGLLHKPDGEILSQRFKLHAKINIVHMNADTALRDSLKIRKAGITHEQSVGYWAWELEFLPKRWNSSFSFFDAIWASTSFAKGSFDAPAFRPITKVPMAVVVKRPSGRLDRSHFGLGSSSYIFFFMYDMRSFTSRKNPQAVIQAFSLAFPDKKEDVELVLKVQGVDCNSEDWKLLLRACSDERIKILDQSLPADELIELVDQCDVFVSLHRSEGFGRGPAEAMGLGKAVILTDYSGTMEFADATVALPVKYKLIEVKIEDYPGAEGQKWADADVAHAAERMRWCFGNPDEARAIGARARRRIRRRHSPRSIGQILLREIGLLGCSLIVKTPVPTSDPKR